MNLQHVVKINGVICPILDRQRILMYGRIKLLYKDKIVENHVLTGRFISTKIHGGKSL